MSDEIEIHMDYRSYPRSLWERFAIWRHNVGFALGELWHTITTFPSKEGRTLVSIYPDPFVMVKDDAINQPEESRAK